MEGPSQGKEPRRPPRAAGRLWGEGQGQEAVVGRRGKRANESQRLPPPPLSLKEPEEGDGRSGRRALASLQRFLPLVKPSLSTALYSLRCVLLPGVKVSRQVGVAWGGGPEPPGHRPVSPLTTAWGHRGLRAAGSHPSLMMARQAWG